VSSHRAAGKEYIGNTSVTIEIVICDDLNLLIVTMFI